MFDSRARTADVMAESQLRCIALSRDTVLRALRSERDLAWRCSGCSTSGSADRYIARRRTWTLGAHGRILER
jgi:hypothetical protein